MYLIQSMKIIFLSSITPRLNGISLKINCFQTSHEDFKMLINCFKILTSNKYYAGP